MFVFLIRLQRYQTSRVLIVKTFGPKNKRIIMIPHIAELNSKDITCSLIESLSQVLFCQFQWSHHVLWAETLWWRKFELSSERPSQNNWNIYSRQRVLRTMCWRGHPIIPGDIRDTNKWYAWICEETQSNIISKAMGIYL